MTMMLPPLLHTGLLLFSVCFPCSATCDLLSLLLSHCTVRAIVDAAFLFFIAAAICYQSIGCFDLFFFLKILRFFQHRPSKHGRSCYVAIPCITKLVLLPFSIAAVDFF